MKILSTFTSSYTEKLHSLGKSFSFSTKNSVQSQRKTIYLLAIHLAVMLTLGSKMKAAKIVGLCTGA